MPEVKSVQTLIKKISRAFPHGQVAFGHYVFEDGVVTMTDREGKPAVDHEGKKYIQKLGSDATATDAAQAAQRMTRQLRKALLGNNAPVAGFNSPIPYRKNRVV